MYRQTKYKTLSRKNMDAAVEICCHLKDNFSINEKTFGAIYEKETGKCGYNNPTNWKTIKELLFQHKLITSQKINGFRLYIATQKCIRTNVENLFREIQYVYNSDIDEAIKWQEMNNGLIPIAMEANVIATNFLGLEGNSKKEFIQLTIEIQQYLNEIDILHNMPKPRKTSFLGAIRALSHTIKKLD